MNLQHPLSLSRTVFGGCLVMVAVLSAGAAMFDVRIPAEFEKAVSTNETLTRLSTGYGWIEGPVWVPHDGGYLVFSDQSNKRMHRWSAAQGATVFRNPSNNANGNTLDLNERLITCETDTRRVVLTDTNGTIRTLVSAYNGKAFNSPNDAVVKSDGTVWFTDPNYGLGQVQPGRYVYRFVLTNGNATVTTVATDFTQPNGLSFSPDEKLLYVADSDNTKHHIRVFDVRADNTLANGRVFCTIGNGVPDGIRCDVDGRVWSSARDGVHIYLPDGRLAGKILVTNTVANVAFGGPDWKTLYIVAQPSLYSIQVKVAGTPSMKRLRLSAIPGQIRLAWPAPSTGFQLERAQRLAGASWTEFPEPATISNGENTVAILTTNPSAFFRLKKLGN
jgi:gluconolactonase